MDKLGINDGTTYWKIGSDVWYTLSSELDHNQSPMGLRWECSFDHFMLFRDTAYRLVV